MQFFCVGFCSVVFCWSKRVFDNVSGANDKSISDIGACLLLSIELLLVQSTFTSLLKVAQPFKAVFQKITCTVSVILLFSLVGKRTESRFQLFNSN
ncbi:hypothetical protein BDC45DRAFT_497570 [Circinella umbellata]|nr:hypothetical protein BDC45DRAFT_497570 [Circinella umbellata]